LRTVGSSNPDLSLRAKWRIVSWLKSKCLKKLFRFYCQILCKKCFEHVVKQNDKQLKNFNKNICNSNFTFFLFSLEHQTSKNDLLPCEKKVFLALNNKKFKMIFFQWMLFLVCCFSVFFCCYWGHRLCQICCHQVLFCFVLFGPFHLLPRCSIVLTDKLYSELVDISIYIGDWFFSKTSTFLETFVVKPGMFERTD